MPLRSVRFGPVQQLHISRKMGGGGGGGGSFSIYVAAGLHN